MARSIKKGPFCDDHLMKKVVAANEANSINCIRAACRATIESAKAEIIIRAGRIRANSAVTDPRAETNHR